MAYHWWCISDVHLRSFSYVCSFLSLCSHFSLTIISFIKTYSLSSLNNWAQCPQIEILQTMARMNSSSFKLFVFHVCCHHKSLIHMTYSEAAWGSRDHRFGKYPVSWHGFFFLQNDMCHKIGDFLNVPGHFLANSNANKVKLNCIVFLLALTILGL